MEINRRLICEGKTISRSPDTNGEDIDREYSVRGEIRGGHLILTQVCLADPGDVICSIYDNLYSESQMVGVSSSLDWGKQLYTSISILSKRRIDLCGDLEEICDLLNNPQHQNYTVELLNIYDKSKG
ncbi:MAG: hypothetical protein AAGG38_11885 [Planctomycetota bacterium]